MRRTITKICGRCGKFVIVNEQPGDCQCNESRNRAHFVPDLTERFNHGLGEMCCGTRDAEKKAKRKGLTPIGDAKINSRLEREPLNVDAIIKDGMQRVRAMEARL